MNRELRKAIYNTIISNLDIDKDIRFIFCDISKAFDRVWHTGLLKAIGRKFVMSDAASIFLYTGVTCERFQIYGSCPHCND
jgi:hypothetical protein